MAAFSPAINQILVTSINNYLAKTNCISIIFRTFAAPIFKVTNKVSRS